MTMSESLLRELFPRFDELNFVDFPQGSPEWLGWRKTGIGGSEIAALLGLSKWTSALTLWRNKKGLDHDVPSSWQMRLGKHNESLIAEDWAERNGVTLIEVPCISDKAHPHRKVSIDRIGIFSDGHAEIIEIKWSGKGIDGVPSFYYTQVLWYMAVTGIHKARLVVADPWNEPDARIIDWNEDVAASLCEAVDDWWQTHIVGDEAPEPSSLDESKMAALEKLKWATKDIPAGDSAEEIAQQLADAKDAIKTAEQAVKAAEVRMLEYMAERGASKIIGGNWSAKIVERARTISYSAVVKALKVDKEMLEAYRGTGSRYLVFKVDGCCNE